LGYSKKNAVRVGVFSIVVGVVALLNPDGGEVYMMAGESWLTRFFISTVWGTTLGWGMTAIGALVLLFGVFSSDDDCD
jgi:hypothetical protein